MIFEGELGKKMMIEQRYVPATCTLPDEFAGPLIFSEVQSGRDPCGGCHADRAVCGGRPEYKPEFAMTEQLREEEAAWDRRRKARLGPPQPENSYEIVGWSEPIK